MSSERDLMRIVIVGHVDHGKSTLVGRLFHDTGSLPEGKLEQIKAMCERRGMPFEWAFLMDAFQSERDQGITIDTSQIWFKTPKRDYVIIDAPGHREFIKNMITGASSAEAAIMLIDASHGVQQQSRTHAFLLNLLGIRQIIVVVNKMDLAGCAESTFAAIKAEYVRYLGDIGIVPGFVIPAVARDGDNLVHKSERMDWYRDATLIAALDSFRSQGELADLPLRLPVQDVYKFDDRRILAGRIASGRLEVGDRLLFSPSNKEARVKSIEAWSAAAPERAGPGQSIGFTTDEQLFIERGEIASHLDDAPIETNVFRGRLFWLGRTPLVRGAAYRLRLQTRDVQVVFEAIDAIYDPEALAQRPADKVERNEIADVVLRSYAMLALDEAGQNPRTGRFVLSDGVNIVAGGTISMRDYPDQRNLITIRSTNVRAEAHRITNVQRITRNGHKGGVLWFTGLSGAGKSTIAMAVEQELFRRGYQAYVLDGDNVR
ncbi:MAG TPA: GTP-binding protein, partial [Dongiaceae bacterium]